MRINSRLGSMKIKLYKQHTSSAYSSCTPGPSQSTSRESCHAVPYVETWLFWDTGHLVSQFLNLFLTVHELAYIANCLSFLILIEGSGTILPTWHQRWSLGRPLEVWHILLKEHALKNVILEKLLCDGHWFGASFSIAFYSPVWARWGAKWDLHSSILTYLPWLCGPNSLQIWIQSHPCHTLPWTMDKSPELSVQLLICNTELMFLLPSWMVSWLGQGLSNNMCRQCLGQQCPVLGVTSTRRAAADNGPSAGSWRVQMKVSRFSREELQKRQCIRKAECR